MSKLAVERPCLARFIELELPEITGPQVKGHAHIRPATAHAVFYQRRAKAVEAVLHEGSAEAKENLGIVKVFIQSGIVKLYSLTDIP